MKVNLYMKVIQFWSGGNEILKRELDMPFPPQVGMYITLTKDGHDGYTVESWGYEAHDGSCYANLDEWACHDEEIYKEEMKDLKKDGWKK